VSFLLLNLGACPGAGVAGGVLLLVQTVLHAGVKPSASLSDK
jgi:hypothetical protein